jgi:hypothetical protein
LQERRAVVLAHLTSTGKSTSPLRNGHSALERLRPVRRELAVVGGPVADYSNDDCGGRRYGRGGFTGNQTLIEGGNHVSASFPRPARDQGTSSLLTSVAIAGTTEATSTTEPEPGAVQTVPPDESSAGASGTRLTASSTLVVAAIFTSTARAPVRPPLSICTVTEARHRTPVASRACCKTTTASSSTTEPTLGEAIRRRDR